MTPLRYLRLPPTDFIPSGSPFVDLALNVLGGVEIAVLLVAFILFGRRPKDWGRAQ